MDEIDVINSIIDSNFVGDEIGSSWVTLRQSVSQSVSQSVGHTFVMPQLIFQTLKNNYLSQDIIFDIGITRATAETGFDD